MSSGHGRPPRPDDLPDDRTHLPEGGGTGIRPRERTPGPEHPPAGDLGGQPVNADETAPRELVPGPEEAGFGGGSGTGPRHPEAVDDEPGSDL